MTARRLVFIAAIVNKNPPQRHGDAEVREGREISTKGESDFYLANVAGKPALLIRGCSTAALGCASLTLLPVPIFKLQNAWLQETYTSQESFGLTESLECPAGSARLMLITVTGVAL